MVALILVQIVVYMAWPPPAFDGPALPWFELPRENRLLGLLSLDLFYLVDSALLAVMYLALYVALKKTSESAMLVGTILGLANNLMRVLPASRTTELCDTLEAVERAHKKNKRHARGNARYPIIALALADRLRAREMLVFGALRADYLETSGPLADTAAALLPRQPMLLHNSVWDWSLGHPAALEQREVLPRTLHALRRTRAPWFSVHLGFGAAEVGFDKGRMRAQTAPLGREELFGNTVRNVRGLAAQIPMPLFLENLDYNPGGAYEHVCQPDFIAAVLEESKVDLLLDLAHARVSASRLGLSTTDYLMWLPMERVRQIHVSGPRVRDGILVDAHEPLQEEDYGLLRNVLDVTTPRALTLEYDRNASALKEQVGQLRNILKRQR